MDSLHSKLAWKYVSGRSLWADFMASKYRRTSTASISYIPSWASHCLKVIHEKMPFIIQDSKWILGAGDLSFWQYHWAEDTLNIPSPNLPDITVKAALNSPDFLDSLWPHHFVRNLPHIIKSILSLALLTFFPGLLTLRVSFLLLVFGIASGLEASFFNGMHFYGIQSYQNGG